MIDNHYHEWSTKIIIYALVMNTFPLISLYAIMNLTINESTLFISTFLIAYFICSIGMTLNANYFMYVLYKHQLSESNLKISILVSVGCAVLCVTYGLVFAFSSSFNKFLFFPVHTVNCEHFEYCTCYILQYISMVSVIKACFLISYAIYLGITLFLPINLSINSVNNSAILFYDTEVDKDETCSICLEHDSTTLSPWCATKCLHKYHKICINKWTQTSEKCPLCRCNLT